tara:strand:+ start:520 stop:747 length:228 start_codon:yes stop_codon:yes gene_type:complete
MDNSGLQGVKMVIISYGNLDDIEDDVIRNELKMYFKSIVKEILQYEKGGFYDESFVDNQLDSIRGLLEARIDFED